MAESYSTDLARKIAAEYSSVLKEHMKQLSSSVHSPRISSIEVDLRIEPVPFLPQDFDLNNPFVKEIVDTGQIIFPT